MKLYYARPSPFVRKVCVTALELGLMEKITFQSLAVTPVSPDQELVLENPLGKIPCLVTADGTNLFDSRVITAYLSSLVSDPDLIPENRRFEVLRQETLADGICDALVLYRYETFLRPEERRWEEWSDNQLKKATRAMDFCERNVSFLQEGLTLGSIATACALGYADFRNPDLKWRDTRPKLAAWFDEMEKRPSMQETTPE